MLETLKTFFEIYSVPTLLVILVAYLLGSINFAIIVTRLYIKKDIRNFGSGNAGATNVLRSVGLLPSLLTFAGDFAKQVASILLGRLIFSLMLSPVLTAQEMELVIRYSAYVAGLSCFFGHLYPVFFGFRGGKGVATSAAIMALIDWRVFLINIAVFIIIVICTRIISLGSILCGLLYPVITFCVTYFGDYQKLIPSTTTYSLNYVIIATIFAAVIGGLIAIKHRANIVRLIHKTEKPISFKKKVEVKSAEK